MITKTHENIFRPLSKPEILFLNTKEIAQNVNSVNYTKSDSSLKFI